MTTRRRRIPTLRFAVPSNPPTFEQLALALVADFLSWPPEDRRAVLATWDAGTLHRFRSLLDPLDVTVVLVDRIGRARDALREENR